MVPCLGRCGKANLWRLASLREVLYKRTQHVALQRCTSLHVLSSQASRFFCKKRPVPPPKLVTSLGKSVRRSNVRDPPAESRCREQYSVHALQRFGRMCEATGPARHGLDEPFDAWASRLPGSHSGHSAGISLATSSDVSSDLQQEA